MKHPQYIFAFNKKAFGPLEPGVNHMTIAALKERADRSLFVGRRHDLETNEDFGQVLPYIVISNSTGLFTYRRTKLVGEERLAGLKSVGVGGHIDASDANFSAPSIIDPLATFAVAIGRELDEELIVITPDGEEIRFSTMDLAHNKIIPVMTALINDESNEVGRVHYGLFMHIRFPDGYGLRCREAELETIGFEPAGPASDEYENWSKLVIQFLYEDAH